MVSRRVPARVSKKYTNTFWKKNDFRNPKKIRPKGFVLKEIRLQRGIK